MVDSELQDTADKVMSSTYWQIFPDPYAVKFVYRKLAQILHPDRHNGPQRDLAATAFAQLAILQGEAEKALAEDRYGTPLVMATIRTRKAVHTVRTKFIDGDLTTLYRAGTTTEDGTVESLIKVARSPKDNDLIAAEASALKRLHATPDDLERHIPVLLDTFVYKEGQRRANAIGFLDGYSSVEHIRRVYGSKGIDPRHVVWMWRRLLMALGYAHDLGVVHGAVLPPHIMIEPKDHAVMLVDWCYSSTCVDEMYPPVKAVVPDWGFFYPEEIPAKEPPSPATDIAMAAYSMAYMSNLPRPMRAFFRGCVLQKQRMRPQNAWSLLKEFDELLEQIGEPFHPRRWVEFAVPIGVA